MRPLDIILFLSLVLTQATPGYTHDRPLTLPEAKVDSLRVYTKQSSFEFEWDTTFESGQGYFLVLAKDGVDHWTTLSPPIPMQGDDSGWLYSYAHQSDNTSATQNFALQFNSYLGTSETLAEYSGIPRPRPIAPLGMTTTSAPLATEDGHGWLDGTARVIAWDKNQAASRVRIGLKKAGLYRIPADELALASGWDEHQIKLSFSSNNFQLTNEGQSVPWFSIGDTLYFYGTPTKERYAPENVYWLSTGTGQQLSAWQSPFPANGNISPWHTGHIIHKQATFLARLMYSTMTNASYVSSSATLLAGSSASYSIELPDSAPGIWEGEVILNLNSYHESNASAHKVAVSMGGNPLGTQSWYGEQMLPLVFSFSSDDLQTGKANITIKNDLARPVSGNDTTRFTCISLEFKYRRLHNASANRYQGGGTSDNLIAIAGFEHSDIIALDVTSPEAPSAVEPLVTMKFPDEDRISAIFANDSPDKVYHAASLSSGTASPSLRGVSDAFWSSSKTPQYAIIVPPEAWRSGFREEAEPLASHHNQRGLSTAIYDVEQIYNRFSHGIATPRAIREFVKTTYQDGLRYLLIAGSGSLDFQFEALNINSYNATLIPPYILGQTFWTGEGMTVAVDGLMGDITGDNIPDIAVGRIPASNTKDLRTAVEKAIAYDLNQSYKLESILSADWDNLASMYYPFANASEKLVPLLKPLNYPLSRHYVTTSSSASNVRVNSLIPALRRGSRIFYFIGHTNEQSMGSSNPRLFTSYSQISPVNWNSPTIAIIIGCRSSRWQGITSTTIFIPYGLFTENTGFAAAIGATGDIMASEGEFFSKAMFDNQGSRPSKQRLGDLWLRAMQASAGQITPERLLCISLVGDPAMAVSTDPRTLLMIK